MNVLRERSPSPRRPSSSTSGLFACTALVSTMEMVVATLDYSSSTASAYLHQFTLLRILDCRKEDVNMYQFLVNPKEHPEVFEDVA